MLRENGDFASCWTVGLFYAQATGFLFRVMTPVQLAGSSLFRF
jgi:hypothetical protein